MKINKDYFNQIEIPTFILRKACDDRVETIPVIAATYDQKYMDIDEIQITTPLLIDNLGYFQSFAFTNKAILNNLGHKSF